jgi:type VI secretion system protein ImpB
MAESTQKKLERVRAPRVNISYDVETGGAIEQKSLPFVMGILGDFTGMPTEPLARSRTGSSSRSTPTTSTTCWRA